MLGQTVSHYKILEKLGEGGMGVVYKAQDTRLDRTVALKFLPPGAVPSSEDALRFQREAKAISALNHPQIAILYDVGEAEGRKFLVLEYLPGDTLKSRISRLRSENKQLSFEQVRDYALQIAGGLAHAHGQGFVHRDVKSD
ncbi:MAG: serine/threonine protein kinase, partial [candidate division Zixibacteria bacterium]|nr:serine/threonine protein kinase [candidate division Zixibacteria bacterium]